MHKESVLFLANIGQLLTLRSSSEKPGPRRGPGLKQLGIIENGAVLCLGGKIVSVGTTKDALRDPWMKKNRKKVLEMIAKAPASARELFKIAQEDGKIVWYWRRLTFVAGKI